MGFLTPFFHPTDSRWQGPQKALLWLSLVKSIILIAFIVLAIVEIRLWDKWSGQEYDDLEYYGDSFFLRFGVSTFPELVYTIYSLWAISASKFHPVTAISCSTIMFCLWTSGAFLMIFLAMSSELMYEMNYAWERLCYGEGGLMLAIAALYIAMMVFSGIAVHRWRAEKRKETYGLARMGSDASERA
ncbi:hypothetical protein P154DRAFT_521059 [Amniculicola lignicola CBS 123094]|uniref:MARVEL domain-containing protein n=1 Tax=Amniculicola lignicola CBS 123094 TaxID=1392246 RepID=A0A6A5WN94_9PLEO|nr:hypothetical protein P154DRAFT_521059 [Amniculicola lignicola CBS 123094]